MNDETACDLSRGELISRVHLSRGLLDELVVGYLAEYREMMSGNTGYLGEFDHALPEAVSGIRVVWCEDGVTLERRRLPAARFDAAQVTLTVSPDGMESPEFKAIDRVTAV